MLAAVLALLLSPDAGARDGTAYLTATFACAYRGYYHPVSTDAQPWLMWSSASPRGLENLTVRGDGLVSLGLQRTEGGADVDCWARLPPERLATLKADVAKVRVCRARSAPTRWDRRHVSFLLELGSGQRCDLKMPATRWVKSPITSALQRVLDDLHRELCGADCRETEAAK
jgi:hypothetical protein